MISVKICGITRTEDARYAQELGAAAIGFIFYPESPRYLTFERAGEIASRLNGEVKKVGVFVNETLSRI
ncbi:MAG TPA: N-(5'-phosphoribosyl)anthranilate isomerase, partial [bacterium]|nr:N-(5'-phosphoribosyl)anthranilate isomerase [bacterium]